jgi:hypothetical protein
MVQISITMIDFLLLSSLLVVILLYFGTLDANKTILKFRLEKTNKKNHESQSEIVSNVGDKTDLHYLKDISNEKIMVLKVDRINSILDLRKKIISQNDIEIYSEKLKIRKKLVEDWVNLGEFSSLYGITSSYIHQLNKIGINSVAELSLQNAMSVLNALQKIQDEQSTLLSIGLIKYWIRNAKKVEEARIIQ